MSVPISIPHRNWILNFENWVIAGYLHLTILCAMLNSIASHFGFSNGSVIRSQGYAAFGMVRFFWFYYVYIDRHIDCSCEWEDMVLFCVGEFNIEKCQIFKVNALNKWSGLIVVYRSGKACLGKWEMRSLRADGMLSQSKGCWCDGRSEGYILHLRISLSSNFSRWHRYV